METTGFEPGYAGYKAAALPYVPPIHSFTEKRRQSGQDLNPRPSTSMHSPLDRSATLASQDINITFESKLVNSFSFYVSLLNTLFLISLSLSFFMSLPITLISSITLFASPSVWSFYLFLLSLPHPLYQLNPFRTKEMISSKKMT